jgi:DNA polymerase III subunit alpha
LKYELDTINKLGYTEYFIVVSDIVDWAKNNGILVGCGRGSVGGSLVAYIMGITTIDPIRYDLLFERFLDPSGQRVSLPDIDLDFEDGERDRVFGYIVEKYGSDNVCNVGNLSTLVFKSSMKDVAKALDIKFETANNYTKLIPFGVKSKEDLLNVKTYGRQQLASSLRTNKEFIRLVDLADKVKGTVRSLGTHAAGVIIAPNEITNYTPLQIIDKNSGKKTSQLDKDSIEKLGLVKIDILGLTALTTIKKTLKLIKDRHNIDIDLDKIDLDDPMIYDQIVNGHTIGIFQMESRGMTELASQIQVSNQKEICDLIALYRPGVLDSNLQENYVHNKFNPDTEILIHEKLKPITDSTYGILLYQEQVIKALVLLAKFTPAEADIMRRAIGKKSIKDIPVMKKKFITGCVKNGVEKEDAMYIFSIFETASYLFNKSHSCSYAVIACQTAWLKHYYPIEYMCSLLNAESGDLDKIRVIKQEIDRLGINTTGPNVFYSESEFSIKENCIQYGLSSVKEIGPASAKVLLDLVQSIIDEQSLNFKRLIDIMERDGLLNSFKSKLEVLIKCGYFDSIYANRQELLGRLEEFSNINKAKIIKSATKTSLLSITDICGEKSKKTTDDFNLNRKRMLEDELLGMQFS